VGLDGTISEGTDWINADSINADWDRFDRVRAQGTSSSGNIDPGSNVSRGSRANEAKRAKRKKDEAKKAKRGKLG
jgi:hypothetical protein